MPFREKSAWITLACLLATFGVFFGAMAIGLIEPYGMRSIHYFLHVVLAYIVLRIVLHIIARRTATKDEIMPLDEREQIISLKAARNANIALIIGVLLVPLSMHVDLHRPGMAYMVMLALVVGEIVREISRIIYFRLGH